MMREVTPSILREFLAYDPETGSLTWNSRDRAHFTSDNQYVVWHKKYAGREAFTAISSSGYRAGALWRKGLLAHRVVWAIVHGEWPAQDIDHINHIRTDNRLANLRCVTRAENARNRKKPRNSGRERVGVAWDGRIRKWCAAGSADGRSVHLGSFTAFDDACERRERFERDMGYHSNHGLLETV